MTGRYNGVFVCWYINPIYPHEILVSCNGLLYDEHDTHISELCRAYYTFKLADHGAIKDIAHNGRYDKKDIDYITKVILNRENR